MDKLLFDDIIDPNYIINYLNFKRHEKQGTINRTRRTRT